MRMTDIIKVGGRNNFSKGKFKHGQSWQKDHDGALQMKRLNTRESSFTGEDKSAEELYQKCFTEIRRIFNRAIISFDILPPANLIRNLAMETAGKLQLGHVNIIDFFARPAPEDENYLPSHTVNVTFLAVMIGVWLNYNKSQLYQLAVASMFHDIGMVKVLDIVQLPRGLSSSEREEVRTHPAHSKEFLTQIQGTDDKTIDAVYNHHRRPDDRGQRVGDYSQIIGLADTFEAMTHPRVYKNAEQLHSAIRTIIEKQRAEFDSKIIKVLVDNLGIYPAGTLVSLDTGEIGVVIDVNHGCPLSPKLNILFDKDSEKLSEPRTVDLSKQTNIHIESPLGDEALQAVKERLLG